MRRMGAYPPSCSCNDNKFSLTSSLPTIGSEVSVTLPFGLTLILRKTSNTEARLFVTVTEEVENLTVYIGRFTHWNGGVEWQTNENYNQAMLTMNEEYNLDNSVYLSSNDYSLLRIWFDQELWEAQYYARTNGALVWMSYDKLN